MLVFIVIVFMNFKIDFCFSVFLIEATLTSRARFRSTYRFKIPLWVSKKKSSKKLLIMSDITGNFLEKS